jgi:hypothetical protein
MPPVETGTGPGSVNAGSAEAIMPVMSIVKIVPVIGRMRRMRIVKLSVAPRVIIVIISGSRHDLIAVWIWPGLAIGIIVAVIVIISLNGLRGDYNHVL